MAAPNFKRTLRDKKPFSLAVDLAFLYPSEGHSRVYDEVLAAIDRREGLICLTGDPGTGKTVICRRLLEELSDDYNVVLVNTPPKTPDEMTQTLDDTFAEMNGDTKIPVAIFDEAQHFDDHCLDHVEFLTNLEKNGGKLLQIVLVGQPELAETLSQRRFSQLEQRIGAKLKLGTLKKKEILAYLSHRLTVAGLGEELRFSRGAANYFFKRTQGVPRLINRIANIAVEQALERKKHKIGAAIVKRAEGKVNAARGDWIEERKPAVNAPRLAALLAVLVLLTGAYVYQNPEWRDWLMRVRRAETQAVTGPSRIALTVGTFLKKTEADEMQEKLAIEGFPAMVLSKDLGDGWTLYQVRLTGSYSPAEAESEMDKLRSIGIQTADKIPVGSRSAH
ncbi:MAG: AAA family ATPase [Deltaproteobacteria bacterium]|nr:AAA family ATPase [Deltaproteobacteria bacterium]